MAFASIVTLLLFYYLHPQDWMPGMSGFNMAKLAVLGGVIGLLTRSRDQPRWRFLSSPQECALLIFLGYAVYTSADPSGTFTDLGGLVVFAVITLHTLTSEALLVRYMHWWLMALIGVLILVGLTMAGWDITDARSLIDKMEGRFCLGTYNLNNPNALGHTLVVVVPLTYFLWFWSRNAFSRLMAIILMGCGVAAVIPTQSKGAFISGAISFIVAIMFGRKLMTQVIVGLMALAMGGTILSTLPRMEQMKRLGSDEGVQGRMLAWQVARGITRSQPTGLGYKQFHPMIRYEGVLQEKATHSSFVMVGGDLGPVGLTLYVGMLLMCGRTLVQYRGLTTEMERCRRALFALLLGICISGWMLDHAYYMEIFCMIGAVGAYHLLSVKQRREAAWEDQTRIMPDADHETALASYGLSLAQAKGTGVMMGTKAADDEEMSVDPAQRLNSLRVAGLWTHLGLLDVALVIVAGQVTLQFWDYVLETVKP